MNSPCSALKFFVFALPFSALLFSVEAAENNLHLTLRSRTRSPLAGENSFSVTEKKADWDPKRTAIVICDMWDDHWCKSAARRVSELAGPMNEVVKAARSQGVFIIHSPSSVVNFYNDTPQRKRAQN